MLIQVNTDKNIEGNEDLASYVEGIVTQRLNHFTDQITRVEVHLGDENSLKEGSDDKRCMLEARVAGMQPIAVTHHAETLDHAIYGAADKLKRSLESAVGKRRDS